MTFYDDLETRSQDAREADQFAQARVLVARVQASVGDAWPDGALSDLADLQRFPVLRKSTLSDWQAARPPFGGVEMGEYTHLFQSPGPIYEPGNLAKPDWWRFGRFLHAAGFGASDVVQNCFSYHFTPAGMMFEAGARAVGAKVFPAGTGQTELQAQAALAMGVTAYAGTPDYLNIILDKADELDLRLGITKAAVGGGALFPSLRQNYADRGITCLQCYATADLGNIAYESPAMEGMILDEGVVVEIVIPGTGDPVADGEVGEVVVTLLNPDFPLIRFGTGDLSAFMEGTSPCGRTNRRIKGWMGRADQTAKIKGMFVRPEQVAAFVAKNDGVQRARVTVTRKAEADVMHVQVEGQGDADALAQSVRDVMKLGATVEIVPIGHLPKDGKVIDDQRQYD